MAITFIYPIKTTAQNSLEYDKEDKKGTIIENKNDGRDSLNYVIRDKKGNTYSLSSEYLNKMGSYISYEADNQIVFKTISTGLNCSVDNTHNEWEIVREIMNPSKGKTGNLQYCIVQNFGIDLDPMIANEIGVRFAHEYLSDYQVVVSTHINTGYVHNHIEFNATSFINGNKFNDKLKTITDIRRISDKYCKEYELAVLEKTTECKLITYVDGEGNKKVWEPTERKNKIKEGEYANKSDYRNTEQYKSYSPYPKTHANALKKDIDEILPLVSTYDELLTELKNKDYEVKDKTKKGEWRAHISFKLPSWERFVRDSNVGEEYIRENLSKKILNNQLNIVKQDFVSLPDSVNNTEKTDTSILLSNIDDINDEYREKKINNRFIKTQRSEIEKYIISDTKQLNSMLKNTINKAMHPRKTRIQELAAGSKREQFLIDRINGNLKTLHFIENNDINSFEQINQIVQGLYDKRNKCYDQINLISKALKKANANIVLINKYQNLSDTIKNNVGNPDYELFEKQNDIVLLESFKEALREKNLNDIESQNIYIGKYNEFNKTFKQLSKALESVNRDLQEYDNCIFNISTIDKNNSNRYARQIEIYYQNRTDNQPDKKNIKERS